MQEKGFSGFVRQIMNMNVASSLLPIWSKIFLQKQLFQVIVWNSAYLFLKCFLIFSYFQPQVSCTQVSYKTTCNPNLTPSSISIGGELPYYYTPKSSVSACKFIIFRFSGTVSSTKNGPASSCIDAAGVVPGQWRHRRRLGLLLRDPKL